ncbi:MAG: T9SS type A sorting domain-containing protein, partial [Bacteroidota bacterium]
GDSNGSIQLLKSNDQVPWMSLENRDQLPGPEDLTFSRIQIPWQNYRQGPNFNDNHDLVTLRIHNLGKTELQIDSLELSNPDYWKIAYLENENAIRDSSWTYPIAIAPDQYQDVIVAFIAQDPPGARSGRIKILHEKLTIRSNDPGFPIKEVHLHGLWQKEGEDFREPRLQEIIDAFSWSTQVGFTKRKEGGDTTAQADEVIARYFEVADPEKPVLIRQIAAYHGCCHEPEITYYNDRDPEVSIQGTLIMAHVDRDGQTLLPRVNRKVGDGRWGRPAQKEIRPSDFFSLIVKKGSSNFNLNYPSREDPLAPGFISHRIYQLKDKSGQLIPNTYLLAQDYTGATANHDYNDNVYYINNVIPRDQLDRNHQAKEERSPKESSMLRDVVDLQLIPNPNPQQGALLGLESVSPLVQIELKIQYLDGRSLYQEKFPYHLFNEKIGKQLPLLKKGTYILQVVYPTGVTSKRFIIH